MNGANVVATTRYAEMPLIFYETRVPSRSRRATLDIQSGYYAPERSEGVRARAGDRGVQARCRPIAIGYFAVAKPGRLAVLRVGSRR
mgnify:CR=1 FL=1